TGVRAYRLVRPAEDSHLRYETFQAPPPATVYAEPFPGPAVPSASPAAQPAGPVTAHQARAPQPSLPLRPQGSKLNPAEATPAGRTVRSCPCPILTPHWLLGRRTEMTAGSLMAAELAQQPEVLGRLVGRHASDRDQVRAVLPGRLAGTVLLARG